MLSKILLAFFMTLSLACQERSKISNDILSEVVEDIRFDPKNWVLCRNSESESGLIDIQLYGFKINTRYLIGDSILYLFDPENNRLPFLDFRLIECNSYTTVDGNYMRLLKVSSVLNDKYYMFLFKMPFSVADHPDMRDRFIICASRKRGILGISEFYEDSTNIRIFNYKGSPELLGDSMFTNSCQ